MSNRFVDRALAAAAGVGVGTGGAEGGGVALVEGEPVAEAELMASYVDWDQL